MAEEKKKKKKKIQKYEVTVTSIVRETADTVTLYMSAGDDPIDYKPGHFCTIDPRQFKFLVRWTDYLEDAKGLKEKPRAYSMASAPHEKDLAVTVKEEFFWLGDTKYPPLLSPVLIHQIPVGTRMEITGFTGPYYLPDDIEERTNHLVHVCAGSGIVPNWSIIKHALFHSMDLKHTLIYGNKTWDDVIYLKALHKLQEQYPDKLKIVHALSREDDSKIKGEHVYKGRVTDELLRKYVPDPSSVHVFSCGPALSKWDKLAAKESGEELRPQFMETMLAKLDELGIAKDRLHKESW